MGARRRRTVRGALLVSFLAFPTRAEAIEVSSGISVGGLLAGTVPHLALSPHVAVSWIRSSGLLLAAHETISILPPIHIDGVGFHAETAAVIGYASEKRDFSVGPSLSGYYLPACGQTLCGHVAGVAPGGHAQVSAYFYGRLGISVNASLEWVGGKSLVLPGNVGASVIAGPVLRWAGE